MKHDAAQQYCWFSNKMKNNHVAYIIQYFGTFIDPLSNLGTFKMTLSPSLLWGIIKLIGFQLTVHI